MRKRYSLLATFVTAIMLPTICISAEMSPKDVWWKVKANLDAPLFSMAISIRTETEDEQVRDLKVRLAQDGRDRHRIEFLEPESQKGKILLHRDKKLWLFLPKMGEAMQVTRGQAIAGGGLVFEDLTCLAIAHGYKPLELKTEDDVYRLRMTSKIPRAIYRQIEVWIDPATWLPTRIDYFLPSGECGKRATVMETVPLEIGMRMRVIRLENLLTRAISVMRIDSYSQPDSFPKDYFKPDALSADVKYEGDPTP